MVIAQIYDNKNKFNESLEFNKNSFKIDNWLKLLKKHNNINNIQFRYSPMIFLYILMAYEKFLWYCEWH